MSKSVNRREVIMLTELTCQLYRSRSAETTDFVTFTLVQLRAKFHLGSGGGMQLKKNNEFSHLGKQDKWPVVCDTKYLLPVVLCQQY